MSIDHSSSNLPSKEDTCLVLQIIAAFCLVEDFLRDHPDLAAWRKSNNAQPEFTDAEVITLALLQPILGTATLKRAYLICKSFLAKDFPKLPGYKAFVARLHRLAPLMGMILMKVALRSATSSSIFLMDSKPIPVCKPIRHGRVRLLRDQGAYFGKNKSGWYFDFKLHVLADTSGVILGAFLTPGNWDDREVAAALVEGLEGESIVIADLGYRDAKELEPLLAQRYGVVLVTPWHAPKHLRWLVSSIRQRIETVFSAFWNRFVDLVFSRSFMGLWSTIRMKMLHYTLGKASLI